MDKHDDIVDIAITEDSVIVYNSKYWRAFDMNGQVGIFGCFYHTSQQRGHSLLKFGHYEKATKVWDNSLSGFNMSGFKAG